MLLGILYNYNDTNIFMSDTVISSAEISVVVKSSSGSAETFNGLDRSSTTVGELKEQVALRTGVPAASQRLIYKGRVMKDEMTLEHYGSCLLLVYCIRVLMYHP